MTALQQKPSLTFFADAMLGKLARWLRMLGYDTAYVRDVKDTLLVERVIQENRWLLTRDRYLAKRKVLRGWHTLLTSDFVSEQLSQLHRELRIDLVVGENTMPRCPECNHILDPTTVEEIRERIPTYVARHHTEFVWCPGCQRPYWPGTHWKHFLDQLEQIRGSKLSC
jgi:uncharacterized protein with PIN domain